MSKRETKHLHVDRSTIHCKEFNNFIILHHEICTEITPDGDWVYGVQEIAILAHNIYKVYNRDDCVRVYYTQGSTCDYEDVIDNLYDILDTIHKITHKLNNENNQTT